jgi:uncharacterized repeat protein (TIGR03803 family)
MVAAAGARAETYGFTNIYTFGSRPDGTDPSPGLVRDAAGNIYGCTYLGGADGDGTVFELSPPAAGHTKWTETILYDFGSVAQYPIAQLGIDAEGALYVTTYFGGSNGGGILLKLAPPGAGQTWTPTVLHNFGGSGDLSTPLGVVVQPKFGTIYGEAKEGGAAGLGGVFKVEQGPDGPTEEVLYSFTSNDGANYYGTLALGKGRTIYGTSPNGGTNKDGLVYELTPGGDGNKWTHTVIHSFKGGKRDGSLVQNGVAEDRQTGVVYGATSGGGTHGLGVIFSLTPPLPGSTTWQETILHDFSDTNGYLGFPMDTMTAVNARDWQSAPPTLWGVSSTGPDGHEPSKNVAYSLRPHMVGGTLKWKLQVWHEFDIKVNGWARGDLLRYDRHTIVGLTRGDEQDEFGTIYMLTGGQ